jgi:hypothetical protein
MQQLQEGSGTSTAESDRPPPPIQIALATLSTDGEEQTDAKRDGRRRSEPMPQIGQQGGDLRKKNGGSDGGATGALPLLSSAKGFNYYDKQIPKELINKVRATCAQLIILPSNFLTRYWRRLHKWRTG